MKRRAFITLLGGAAAAWPIAARAQQPATPVIGFLHGGSFESRANLVAAFRLGLSEAGFVDGRNALIEFRWAQDHPDRLPGLAADLVRRQVSVIAAPGQCRGHRRQSRNRCDSHRLPDRRRPRQTRPGRKPQSARRQCDGRQLFHLRAGTEEARTVAGVDAGGADIFALVNPKTSIADAAVQDLAAVGQQLSVLHASNPQEINAAFPAMAQKRAPALVIIPDALFTGRRVQLATLAARHAIPAIYTSREFAEVGGLMSYGTNLADNWRQVGRYAGRVLKGDKPADLPVMQPTKFELGINLATAQVLGIDVPDTLLARADEVIE